MSENLPEPESRNEQFLAAVAGESVELPDPASRKELYLAAAAGMDGVTVPTPESREEIYLNAIAEGGGGGGGGGGSADASAADIRFIDYDGSVIAGYTLQEASQLTELPALPSHPELTAVGWTHTLSEVTSSKCQLDIGAMYHNAANPRQTILKIYPTENMAITLNITQDVADGVAVNWGDGSAAETSSSTGNISFSHTYTSVEDTDCPYCITLTPNDGVTLGLGHGTTARLFNNNGELQLRIQAILGDCVLSQNTFYGCAGLEYVVIPDFVKDIKVAAFQQCYALRAIVVPNSVTAIRDSAFGYSWSLKTIVIPNSVTTLGNSVFAYDYALARLTFPNNVSVFGSQLCNYTALTNVYIHATVNNMKNNQFRYCYGLKTVKFADRASIPNNFGATGIFQNGSAPFVTELDFTENTTVPTYSGNLLQYMPAYTTIKVPASLAETWKTTSGWSNYSSQIVGV